MKSVKLKLTGTSPLLHCSDTLADPLNHLTILHKTLTDKRKKTMDDHMQIAKSMWTGLLYWSDTAGAILPTSNIRAALVGGATLGKLGMAVKRGTLMLDDYCVLNYGKKLTKDQLYDQGYVDRRSVVVSRRRVMAYRPKFTEWSVECTISYDENTLDESNIVLSMTNAGKFVGIGGYRPEKGGLFGRFEVTKL